MYCTYDSKHITELFEQFKDDQPNVANGLTDFFGVVTSPECAPYLANRTGEKVTIPPYPTDTIRAGFIEYLAVIDSIRFSSSDIYQMAEIGASYAPFTAICGKLALRKGVRKVILRPVEASKKGIESILHNMKINQLSPNENVDIEIFNKAISSKNEVLYFPDVDCTLDNGGATSVENVAVDLRGARVPHIEVDAIPMDEVIRSFHKTHQIDLIHIDVQGAEASVIPDSIGCLNINVKRIMVATHSRSIEGELMDIFHRNGWKLIAEQPVLLNYREDLKSFVGMTIKDGAMYWVNKRFY